jgi:hypothetical protein
MLLAGLTPARALLACALATALPLDASVIVQLKVVEGEGIVYRTGGHAARPLTVLVTDEAGKPVPGASVSFRLPDTGPSGLFATGLRTEVVTTGPDGRASVTGMQWNKAAGPMEIRITAVKDQARAGIISTQYLNDTALPQSRAPRASPAPAAAQNEAPQKAAPEVAAPRGATAPAAAGGEGTFKSSHSGKTKWILIAAAVGGGAAAGMLFARSHGAAVTDTSSPTISIGAPSIIVSIHK